MTEQKLEIKQSVKGDKVYNNLVLKPKFNKATQKEEGGIQSGNHVIVEKVFVDGGTGIESKLFFKKDGSPEISFACKVIYDGVEAAFFLNEKEHAAYASCGGIGDKIKISLTKETYFDLKGTERIAKKLSFVKV